MNDLIPENKKPVTHSVTPGTKKVRHRKSKIARQRIFLDAYVSTLFNVAESCRVAKVGRRTVYNWMEQDKHFRTEMRLCREQRLDFAESQLMQKIKKGCVASTIFFLKCQGKARGWIEQGQRPADGDSGMTPQQVDAVVRAWKVKHGITTIEAVEGPIQALKQLQQSKE